MYLFGSYIYIFLVYIVCWILFISQRTNLVLLIFSIILLFPIYFIYFLIFIIYFLLLYLWLFVSLFLAQWDINHRLLILEISFFDVCIYCYKLSSYNSFGYTVFMLYFHLYLSQDTFFDFLKFPLWHNTCSGVYCLIPMYLCIFFLSSSYWFLVLYLFIQKI